MNKKLLMHGIMLATAFTIIPTHAMRRGGRRRWPSQQEWNEHRNTQQYFLNLQNSLGIPNPSRGVILGEMYAGPQPDIGLAGYTAMRNELNNLLSLTTLADDDVARILKLIEQFDKTNPARWPRPNDYRIILDAKLKRQTAITKPVSQQAQPFVPQPIPQPTTHEGIVQQFLEIQRSLGIPNPSARIIYGRIAVGRQKTDQVGFNAMRNELNNLLSLTTLAKEDIDLIKQRIEELRDARPAKWPRADDYTAVLNAKQRQQAAMPQQPPVVSQPQIPQPPVMQPIQPLSHDEIVQQFLVLQQTFGIQPTPEALRQDRPVTGVPASQEQLNQVRTELNNLLAKATISEDDATLIAQKINVLRGYNPSSWPRTSDYRELLIERRRIE